MNTIFHFVLYLRYNMDITAKTLLECFIKGKNCHLSFLSDYDFNSLRKKSLVG